jgi:hypothetical protein
MTYQFYNLEVNAKCTSIQNIFNICALFGVNHKIVHQCTDVNILIYVSVDLFLL